MTRLGKIIENIIQKYLHIIEDYITFADGKQKC